MGGIFGKSKQKSSNQAYGQLNKSLGPTVGFAQQGGNGISALLGGDSTGFDKYKGATGFDFQGQQGSQGITGNAAARGLLRSGGTGKSLVDFGNNLQQSFADKYLSQLLGLGNLGLGAGGVLAGAGQQSSSKSKPGLGGMLGTIGAGIAGGPIGASIAASDRRLKKNIKPLHSLSNGLRLYSYDYINIPEGSKIKEYMTRSSIGVMADEVRALLPEALGPTIDGYQTVDYSKIGL